MLKKRTHHKLVKPVHFNGNFVQLVVAEINLGEIWQARKEKIRFNFRALERGYGEHTDW